MIRALRNLPLATKFSLILLPVIALLLALLAAIKSSMSSSSLDRKAITELTRKNELILGRRVHRENRPARAKLETLLGSFGVQPKLTRLLNVEPAAAKEPSKTESPA